MAAGSVGDLVTVTTEYYSCNLILMDLPTIALSHDRSLAQNKKTSRNNYITTLILTTVLGLVHSFMQRIFHVEQIAQLEDAAPFDPENEVTAQDPENKAKKHVDTKIRSTPKWLHSGEDLEILITDVQKTSLNSNTPYITYIIRAGIAEARHWYSEFESLRSSLEKLYPTIIIPPIPSKHPSLSNEHGFHRFLGGEVSWVCEVHSPPLSLLPRNILKAPSHNPTDWSAASAYAALPNPSATHPLRNPDQRSVDSEIFTNKFASHLSGPMEKVTRRTLKRWSENAQDYSELGPALNGYSISKTRKTIHLTVQDLKYSSSTIQADPDRFQRQKVADLREMTISMARIHRAWCKKNLKAWHAAEIEKIPDHQNKRPPSPKVFVVFVLLNTLRTIPSHCDLNFYVYIHR
ncbi:hypothetical protein DEU56DRAFT_955995 [Suillus clintonianus]|uniref:uncharacterized protein n=1 Tax=Suillus clintonianus TaxID=1904413 RepID=UPI001B85ED1A|nr:uncharacterized protein DEU56DRAFT_955995 [Suillus clintonianus]KAG2130266.1 hypothetical protein DEU56DRAFT_955995 [Suillus clintonianus]